MAKEMEDRQDHIPQETKQGNIRTPDGKFVKGVVNNKFGRKGRYPNIVKAVHQLATSNAEKAMKYVVGVMNDAEAAPKDRMKAASVVLKMSGVEAAVDRAGEKMADNNPDLMELSSSE